MVHSFIPKYSATTALASPLASPLVNISPQQGTEITSQVDSFSSPFQTQRTQLYSKPAWKAADTREGETKKDKRRKYMSKDTYFK